MVVSDKHRGCIVSAISHLLLAIVLTLFLALQAKSLALVLRHRRAMVAARPPRRTDLVWTCIPVALVLFLAVRSWVAVFGVVQPEIAAAVAQAEPDAIPRTSLPR